MDAHNVVPVWVASDKQEFSARTLRSKLWKVAPYVTLSPHSKKK